MTTKPLLTPRHIVEEKRLVEVCSAICRCHDKNKKIPPEWLREIRDLADHMLMTLHDKIIRS